MAKKFHKGEQTVEATIQAALELMGWQAQLLQAAIRQARAQAAGRRRGGSKGRPAQRT